MLKINKRFIHNLCSVKSIQFNNNIGIFNKKILNSFHDKKLKSTTETPKNILYSQFEKSGEENMNIQHDAKENLKNKIIKYLPLIQNLMKILVSSFIILFIFFVFTPPFIFFVAVIASMWIEMLSAFKSDNR